MLLLAEQDPLLTCNGSCSQNPLHEHTRASLCSKPTIQAWFSNSCLFPLKNKQKTTTKERKTERRPCNASAPHYFFFEFAHKQISAVSILDACQAAWVYFGRWAWLSNIVAVVRTETQIWLFKKKASSWFLLRCDYCRTKKQKNKKSPCCPDA